VLYANNNRELSDLLTKALAVHGLEVKPARTVAEAVWLARTQSIDLYLFDTRFTDDDGFELCRRVRGLNARTPIVFFSAVPAKGAQQNAADAYAIDGDFSALMVATVLQMVAHHRKGRYPRPQATAQSHPHADSVGHLEVDHRLTVR
jgi:DNA-binding response OmpR family regulator